MEGHRVPPIRAAVLGVAVVAALLVVLRPFDLTVDLGRNIPVSGTCDAAASVGLLLFHRRLFHHRTRAAA